MSNEIATVILTHGRYFLVVAGLFIAMETDVCHDPTIIAQYWEKASLDRAAEHINATLAAIGRGEGT